MTFETRNTSCRRPAMASPTMASTFPFPYISAVSMCVIPRSSPRRIAAMDEARFRSISQVPWPMTGTRIPVNPKGRSSMINFGLRISDCGLNNQASSDESRQPSTHQGRQQCSDHQSNEIAVREPDDTQGDDENDREVGG